VGEGSAKNNCSPTSISPVLAFLMKPNGPQSDLVKSKLFISIRSLKTIVTSHSEEI
jgi:hypothetical protein